MKECGKINFEIIIALVVSQMYPCFQGNVLDVSLLFPLIRPRKIIHIHLCIYIHSYYNIFLLLLTGQLTTTYLATQPLIS